MYILNLPFVEKHIIIGAEEGVYSLNFSEKLHEAEMEQVRMSYHYAWVHVVKLQKSFGDLKQRGYPTCLHRQGLYYRCTSCP